MVVDDKERKFRWAAQSSIEPLPDQASLGDGHRRGFGPWRRLSALSDTKPRAKLKALQGGPGGSEGASGLPSAFVKAANSLRVHGRYITFL
jgi:hypothetical protein